MYENGKQMNRYANKMKHKKEMKKSFLKSPYKFHHISWDDYVAHAGEYDRLDYWKTCYLSGVRAYASFRTNRKLRAEFRQALANEDFDALYAPQYGNYKKHFDYWWTIW